MSRLLALTRPVSPFIGRCELTHRPRRPIDVDRARAQHRELERALESLGCRVRRLPAAPQHPDSAFVEDTAFVVDEVAIVARPGAPSRRGEVPPVAEVLSEYRSLRAIESPGTLDGGDVLRVGRTVFVGASERTDASGFEQLARHLGPFGYTACRVPIRGCLHLKTAITAVGDGVMLYNPAWVDPEPFAAFELIEVDGGEPFGANALWVGRTVLCPRVHERTRRRLEDRGLRVLAVDESELAKAEAGLGCCCLLFEEEPGHGREGT